MPYSAWLFSVILHIGLLLLIYLHPSFYQPVPHKTQPVTVMIDLQKMKLADKTNVPAKAQKQTKQPSKVQPPTPPKAPPKKQAEKPVPTPKPKPTPKQAAPVQTKTETPPKPSTQKAEEPAQNKQLQSLLTSIEKRAAKTPPSNQKVPETEQKGPSLDDHLTYTEIDLIRSEIRQAWNVDANAEGLEDIRIHIRISLNIQGQVTDIEILDTENYQKNPLFRSVADSARRAINICAKRGQDSPFRLLAQNHPSDYSHWKEITLNFNPLDESVL